MKQNDILTQILKPKDSFKFYVFWKNIYFWFE